MRWLAILTLLALPIPLGGCPAALTAAAGVVGAGAVQTLGDFRDTTQQELNESLYRQRRYEETKDAEVDRAVDGIMDATDRISADAKTPEDIKGLADLYDIALGYREKHAPQFILERLRERLREVED